MSQLITLWHAYEVSRLDLARPPTHTRNGFHTGSECCDVLGGLWPYSIVEYCAFCVSVLRMQSMLWHFTQTFLEDNLLQKYSSPCIILFYWQDILSVRGRRSHCMFCFSFFFMFENAHKKIHWQVISSIILKLNAKWTLHCHFGRNCTPWKCKLSIWIWDISSYEMEIAISFRQWQHCFKLVLWSHPSVVEGRM